MIASTCTVYPDKCSVNNPALTIFHIKSLIKFVTDFQKVKSSGKIFLNLESLNIFLLG